MNCFSRQGLTGFPPFERYYFQKPGFRTRTGTGSNWRCKPNSRRQSGNRTSVFGSFIFLAGRCTVLNAARCAKVKMVLPEPETRICKVQGDYGSARVAPWKKPPNIARQKRQANRLQWLRRATAGLLSGSNGGLRTVFGSGNLSPEKCGIFASAYRVNGDCQQTVSGQHQIISQNHHA